MMNKILYLLLFLAICSFTTPKYCKISDKIVSSYSQELKKQKGMYLIGKGGAMMKDVEEVMVHYISPDKLNVDQARVLYVEVMEGFLQKYNTDEKIRPFLHNYPFTTRNIDLKIAFEDENKKMQENGCVAYVFKSNKNEIVYEGCQNGNYYTLTDEPYERALEIVKSSSN